MARNARFIPSPAIGSIVKGSRAVETGLEELVDEVATKYADGVGVAEGDLRDSIHGEVVEVEGGYEGRIYADDWKATLHENGTVAQKPNGALRNAIASSGLKLIPKGEEGRS